MSEDTILGGPPSGTEPSTGTDAAPEGSSAAVPADDADAVRAEVPGDATSATHRSRLYALLALGFDRPGDDLEAMLPDGAFADGLVESAAALDCDFMDAAVAAVDALEPVDALHDRWASLFGVEEGVTVSPYELTYLPGPLMTNVRRLADVRGFYEAWDLSVAEGHNDRGDHVCFLAEFMSYLCEQEAYLREADDERGVAIVVDAQRQFLEDHLGRWYWRFAEEVSKHDDGFYAALGDLLAALVERDVDRLDVDPDWVPDDPEVTEWNEDVFGDSGRGCGGCGMNAGGGAGSGGAPGQGPP